MAIQAPRGRWQQNPGGSSCSAPYVPRRDVPVLLELTARAGSHRLNLDEELAHALTALPVCVRIHESETNIPGLPDLRLPGMHAPLRRWMLATKPYSFGTLMSDSLNLAHPPGVEPAGAICPRFAARESVEWWTPRNLAASRSETSGSACLPVIFSPAPSATLQPRSLRAYHPGQARNVSCDKNAKTQAPRCSGAPVRPALLKRTAALRCLVDTLCCGGGSLAVRLCQFGDGVRPCLEVPLESAIEALQVLAPHVRAVLDYPCLAFGARFEIKHPACSLSMASGFPGRRAALTILYTPGEPGSPSAQHWQPHT